MGSGRAELNSSLVLALEHLTTKLCIFPRDGLLERV